jgi:hypothetical protein
MPRPKKGSDVIPDWFKIEKYAGAESFDAKDWYEQLCIRKDLVLFLEDKTHLKIQMSQEVLEEALSIIRENPLDNFDKLCPKNFEEDPAMKYMIFLMGGAFGLRGSYLNVHENLSSNVFLGVDFPTNDAIDYMSSLVEEEKSLLSEEQQEAYEIERTPRKLGNNVLVTVDLSLPNNVLESEFREFLGRLDRDIPSARSVNFHRWHQKGVLPYLDLRIWELAGGNHVTGKSFVRELAKIIDTGGTDESFESYNPDSGDEFQENIADDILRTTRRYAEKLISPSHLRTLYSQAIRERAGFREKSSKLSPA